MNASTNSAPSAEAQAMLMCAEDVVLRRRRAEAEDLGLGLAWADAHARVPRGEGVVSARRGGPKLVRLGGEGTPEIDDLCVAELAVARQAGVVATRNAMADALDLRHRLPRVWAGVQELRCEPWVARRVARLSRELSSEAVELVDSVVAEALGDAPGRVIALAEETVIGADPAAHEQRVADNDARRGVWLSRPRPGDTVDGADGGASAGVRTLVGRLEDAEAIELYDTVDDLAGALAAHGDYDPANPPTRDQLRADALGLLGRPAEALALLTADSADSADGADGADSAGECGQDRRHGRAEVLVHVSAEGLFAPGGVARVPGVGPMLVGRLARLLRRRDITLTPVIDLNHVQRVTGYEHPSAVKRRTELRTAGDVFPHSASGPDVRVDHDHARPYDRDGPPGQTGDHNDAPLTRHHHRAKTHRRYRVDQLALGVYRWITPHGLARVVTPRGTTRVEPITAPDGAVLGEIHRSSTRAR